MKIFSHVLLTGVVVCAIPASATVILSSPSNGSTVGSNVQYVAGANTSSCSLGVAAVGIYVDDSLKFIGAGPNLNTNLNLSSGTHRSVVQAWDYCGSVTSTAVSFTVSNQGGVSVVSPVNGSTVGSSVAYVATAATGCQSGVAAMGVYVDDQLAYVAPGGQLNAQVTMNPGNHKTVVQQWDHCGGVSSASVNLTVSNGTTLSNLQASGGWNQWGELGPAYDICPGPCPGVDWSMNQHVSSTSLSGNATQFNIGGSTPYSDVLWSNPIIGQGTTQNLPDNNHKLLPSLHHFTYDTYVYVTNFSVTQDLEFDLNMYMNGLGMEWGTECNHLDHGVWDIWNNVDARWVPTNIPCSLNDNAWNHVVIQMEREDNNDLLYRSITVNDVTYNINQTVAPFQVPGGWWGMTVNYQMDGNYRQASNTTYLDNLNISYW